MSLPKSKTEKYSYADYLTWSEDEHWELLGGEAYMQAAPSRIHQEILMELAKQIAIYLTGKTCKVYPAPFCVRLDNKNSNEEIKNVVEPDITIVCDQNKLDKRGCKGSPDLIIEILSPSTASIDAIKKYQLYLQSGVQEYWIVDPANQLVQVCILDNNQYSCKFYDRESKVPVSIFNGDLEINLTEVFPPLEEEE